eukprot:scaffold543_cov119-Cylindrotheca_fusiformis.AAC.12
MDVSTTDLYPVVQDLTDAEYGFCNSQMLFGSFSLQELAVPSTTPRSLPSPDREDRKICQCSPQSKHKDSSLVDNRERREEPESGCRFSGQFDDSFVLTRQISRGRISTLWECVHRTTGIRYCVKSIDRRRFASSRDEFTTSNEISIMSFLKKNANASVVQAVQTSQDEHRFYIVMNLVDGGNLASLLLRQDIEEMQVQRFARSLLESVAELHSLGVGHFNLQPENILLGPEFQVSLCDFGSASFVEDMASIRRHSNLAYASPEELLKNPCLASDLWSVGVILYYCFCGHLPFDDPSRKKLKSKIFGHRYDFAAKEWAYVSRSAKQFISSLLHPDPHIRMTAKEALDHAWLSSAPSSRPREKRSRKSRLAISAQSACTVVGFIDASQVGSDPVNALSVRIRDLSLVSFVMPEPTAPAKLLSDRSKDVSFVRENNSVGMLPDNWFEERSRAVSSVASPTSGGMSPVNWLLERSIDSTLGNANISPSSSPVKPRPAK